jgi:2-methylisocitrate lyase-like PEP mutase family enzyme
MEVFQAVKNEMIDSERPQHFSIEQAPEDEKELADRNSQLANLGITAIWFEKGCFDYVENILRHAINELRYRGNTNNVKKDISNKKTMTLFSNRSFFQKFLSWRKFLSE